MTFGLPFVLGIGLLAAAVTVALHFLARAEPAPWALPTARFVPASRDRAVSRAIAPRDLLLLLLRLLAIAALTLAFARPALAVRERPVVTVVVADLSRAADRRAVAAAVGTAEPGSTRIVVLDTAARTIPAESLAALASASAPVARPARLSAGLLRARAEAVEAGREADSVRLVLVSPVTREEVDAALRDVRALWPATIELRRVGLVEPPRAEPRVALRATADDPLRATLALEGRPVVAADVSGTAVVRLVRTASVSSSDSAFAVAGGTVVHWPAATEGADTTGALRTARAVLVGLLPRDARGVRLDAGRATAHWVDGVPAADETTLGRGCLRRVAVPVPAVGDLVLRAAFRGVTRDLLAPCGGVRDLRPAPDSVVAMLEGASPGRAAAVAAADLASPRSEPRLVRLLLALALLALLVEWIFRRRLDQADLAPVSA